MKKFNKFWLVAILFAFAFVLASCGGPTPGPGPKEKTCEEDPTQEKCKQPTGIPCSTDPSQQKCMDPATFDWEINRSKFDGKQMDVKIMVLPKSEYDPFDVNYSGTRQKERQEWHTRVENAYNLNIKYVDYPDDAPWGPTRVNWINEAYTSGLAERGDVFLIDTNWISTFVKNGSVAELANQELKTGFFYDFNYTQNETHNHMTSIRGKTFAYLPGTARPDFFLYYNQDMINEYNLPDPATLWNEGKWDWAAFTSLLQQAKAIIPGSQSAMGGVAAEVVEGFVVARGGRFTNQLNGLVTMKNEIIANTMTDLQNIYDLYWDKSHGVSDVSGQFTSGNVLFATGGLWFIGSKLRFGPAEFEISAVPYPTADGDAATKSNFKIPVAFSAGYAIRPVSNGQNGISSKIIFNILDDLTRGLKPETKVTNPEQEANERYRIWLQSKFDSEQTIDAIMSVQDSKYHRLELLQTLSMTIGNGSHYTDTVNCWYPFAQRVISKKETTASVELASIQPKYEAAMRDILGDN